MQRIDRPERLDSGEAPLDEVRQTLAELEQINCWLGGRAALNRFVYPWLQSQKTDKPIRILDVACGGAGVSLGIARWARANGRSVEIVALDFLHGHLRIAREAVSDFPEIRLVQAEARALPFRSRQFDLVVSTLFLHHLNESELCTALRAFADAARGRFVLNDLTRGRVPLLFFRAFMPLLAKSDITIEDGLISIQRAYTPSEMRTLLHRAGLAQARVHTHGIYYRMSIVG